MSDAKPLSREGDRRKLAEIENELRDAKATVRAAEARADAFAAEGDELARLLDESLEREKVLEAAVDAERERAERFRGAIEDADVAFAYWDATPIGEEGIRVAHIDAAREVLYAALAAADQHRAAQGEG